jgi:oligoribonuclease
MEAQYRSTAYLWFDTEYSDLNIEQASLLQVAAILTDADLQRLHPPEQDLKLYVRLPAETPVSPWVEENLREVLRICRSELALDVAEVERQLVAMIDRYVILPAGEDKRRPILAGNSVHADWWLARRYLPKFIARLHYRHLDVTALKLQWQDWHGGPTFEKDNLDSMRTYFPGAIAGLESGRHDAHYDVQASIAELNFYRHALLAKS